MTFSPQAIEQWQGRGKFIIVHMGAPNTPISQASGSNPADGETIFKLKFELKHTIAADKAAIVKIGGVVAAAATAQEIPTRVAKGTVFTSGPPKAAR